MTDERGRTKEEAVFAFAWKDCEEPRIIGALAGIRTKSLPDTSLERCYCTKLFGWNEAIAFACRQIWRLAKLYCVIREFGASVSDPELETLLLGK
jgi:hypothetical protein